MTGLELLVGVVLGGLVVGLGAMQHVRFERIEGRLRELGEADVKVVAALDRTDEELSAAIEKRDAKISAVADLTKANSDAIKLVINEPLQEHADTLARVCSKLGVRFGKDA